MQHGGITGKKGYDCSFSGSIRPEEIVIRLSEIQELEEETLGYLTKRMKQNGTDNAIALFLKGNFTSNPF